MDFGIVKRQLFLQINDGLLSRDICQSCKGFVSQVIEFKEKVSKVQKLLKKILRRKVVSSNFCILVVVLGKLCLSDGFFLFLDACRAYGSYCCRRSYRKTVTSS